jgi:hypothetical protein
MGEYALYNGQKIHIGVFEDMLSLRADQARLVEPIPTNVDPVRQARALRFRFPFPDEDGIPPGQFENPHRGIPVAAQLGFLATEVPHWKVQFVAREAGYVVRLPCPHSWVGVESDIEYRRNGSTATVRITQQRLWEGRLVLVCTCAACGARFRLPTQTDADPVITACRQAADRAREVGDESRAQWWNDIADRINAGYTAPSDLAEPPGESSPASAAPESSDPGTPS